MIVTTSQVERFRTLVAGVFGFQLDESSSSVLGELLRERATAAGRGVDMYLHGGIDARERGVLARRLTVTETYFFRGSDQLRVVTDILHERARRAALTSVRDTLRMLSAGCASGEEPYSLAMLAREHPNLAVTIRAVDVNPAMLERARRGLYSSWALRETSRDLRARWFRPEGNAFRLAQDVRGAVTFEERNLIDEDRLFWSDGAFDVVFCRNVLMYLSPAVARGVVGRIARSLAPGGLLFLGHAETLRGLSHDFHLRQAHGTFYYERRGLPATDAGDALAAREPVPALGWVESIRRSTDRISSLEGKAASIASAATSPSSSPAGPAMPRWDLGPALELLGRERYDEARAALGALPLDASHDPDVLLLRAILLTHGGDMTEALEACEALLLVDEMSAGAHYLMGLCREADGAPEEAAVHHRLATHLDRSFALARLRLGRLVRRAGDHAEARALLEQALALLDREDGARIILFGGGFRREALTALCRAEMLACGDAS